MEKHPVRVLYLFTSGTFRAANNKKWFRIFLNHADIEVAILIKNCSPEEQAEYKQNFGDKYKVFFFPAQDELLNLSYFQRLKKIRAAASEIDSFDPHIIHIHGLFYTYMLYPLFFIKAKPRIIYNVWGDDFNSAYRQRIKNYLLVRWLIHKSALIWANWYALGDMLKKEFPQAISKIRTIPLGIDEDLFIPASEQDILSVRKKFNIKDNEYILLYARGFYENANQHLLIEAVARLPHNTPFKLILQHSVPGENYEKKLFRLIDQFDLQKNVVISHQYLSDGEMRALFQIADLSFSLTINEQLSRTIFESILSDTHIIFNNIAPYRYLKNMFGFRIDLTEPGNVALLAERINYYTTTKPDTNWDYEKILIRHLFRFEAKSEEFISIYQSLLQ